VDQPDGPLGTGWFRTGVPRNGFLAVCSVDEPNELEFVGVLGLGCFGGSRLVACHGVVPGHGGVVALFDDGGLLLEALFFCGSRLCNPVLPADLDSLVVIVVALR